jgi:hypothetical protein
MRKELFDELMESIREGGAIMRGETKPARVTEIKTMKTKPYEELRAKMSPKARATAGKMTKKMLAELTRQYKPVRHTKEDDARLFAADPKLKAAYDALEDEFAALDAQLATRAATKKGD